MVSHNSSTKGMRYLVLCELESCLTCYMVMVSHNQGYYLSWWATQPQVVPELVSHTTTGTTWVGEPTQPRALPELVSHTITGTTWVGEKLIRTRAYVSSPPTRKKESKVFWWLIESFDSTRVLLLIYVHNLPFPCSKVENFFLQFFLYDWKLHF